MDWDLVVNYYCEHEPEERELSQFLKEAPIEVDYSLNKVGGYWKVCLRVNHYLIEEEAENEEKFIEIVTSLSEKLKPVLAIGGMGEYLPEDEKILQGIEGETFNIDPKEDSYGLFILSKKLIGDKKEQVIKKMKQFGVYKIKDLGEELFIYFFSRSNKIFEQSDWSIDKSISALNELKKVLTEKHNKNLG